jgi:hypothetical protein
MNKITQKGLTPPAPSYLKRGEVRLARNGWIFVVCFCSLMFFFTGLYLGGLTMRNKVAAVEAEMKETQKGLRECAGSVVLVDKGFAEQIGYHPGKKDMVCTGGGGKWQ